MIGSVACLLLLGGCKKATPSKTDQKTVRVVTAGSGLPYSLLEDDKKWSGIEADMWEEIGKRADWNIEVKRASFDSLFGELDSGRADVAANCFAEKAERIEKYYMSIPFYGDSQCLAVKEDQTEIQGFDQLKGKKVGVAAGQASQTILEEMSKDYGFDLTVYEEMNTGYSDVALGRLDAMGGPMTGVNQFNNSATNKVKALDTKLKANNVVYYFAKTDDAKAIEEKVNEIIKEMIDDGTCGKITEKWLYEDMTKYID